MKLIIDIPDIDYEQVMLHCKKNEVVHPIYRYICYGKPLYEITDEIDAEYHEMQFGVEDEYDDGVKNGLRMALDIIAKYTKGE